MAVPDFDQIEGKYQILEKLGGGGMGTVYKVRHRLLDEIRVVKVIRPHLEGDVKLRDRFLREARSAVKLRHPNIATLFDFTMDDDGVAFMVMECINGEDLKRVVRRHDRLPISLGLEVGAQALRALRYLHGRGYVHRDISPDNLMLSRDVEGRLLVKLIDLGVAKSLESSEELTRDGMFVGKFRYGAPEQFGGSGLVVDHRTDLYSLGVVLYEVLTGEHPFPGESEREIVGGHLFHAPRNFDETDPAGRLTNELRLLLLKAMEKTPEDRFEDAEQFSEALREIREGWEEPDEDLVIELATGARQGSAVGPDSSTQVRLDLDFPPEETPPPISEMRVVERTEVDEREATATRLLTQVPVRRRRLVGGIVAAAIVVAGLVYLATRSGSSGDATPEVQTADSLPSELEPSAAAPIEPEPVVEKPETTAESGTSDSAERSTVPDPVDEETAPVEPAVAETARPAPTPPAASGPDPRLAALLGEARTAFNAGRDQETLDRLTSALEIDPRSAATLRLLNELARSAESKSVRAQRSAESAEAPRRAASEFSRASDARAAATRGLAGGRTAEAISAFWSSASLFDAARRSAEESARREQREAREAEARRARERQAEAERQAARQAQQQAAPPPAPKVDERPAVLSTIESFTVAHESLDVANVLEVWPSLSGDRLRAVTSSLEGARAIDMQVSGCVVEAGSASATAKCTLEQSYRPKRGTRQSIRRNVTFRLAKEGGRWVVVDY